MNKISSLKDFIFIFTDTQAITGYSERLRGTATCFFEYMAAITLI